MVFIIIEPHCHTGTYWCSLSSGKKLQQGLSKAIGGCKLTDGFATAVLAQIARLPASEAVSSRNVDLCM